jgi:hypothetical protein
MGDLRPLNLRVALSTAQERRHSFWPDYWLVIGNRLGLSNLLLLLSLHLLKVPIIFSILTFYCLAGHRISIPQALDEPDNSFVPLWLSRYSCWPGVYALIYLIYCEDLLTRR